MAHKLPRTLTREQIAKLSDHNLVRYRKAILDAKQDLEERFLAEEPHQAARMPDGSDRRRGLNQKWDEGGSARVKDITGNDDLSLIKRLTYLAHATDEEMRKRGAGRYKPWEPWKPWSQRPRKREQNHDGRGRKPDPK